jgi:hypothetical protein
MKWIQSLRKYFAESRWDGAARQGTCNTHEVELEWKRSICIQEIQLAMDDPREADSNRDLYALVIREIKDITVPTCLVLDAFVHSGGIGFDFCLNQSNCVIRTLRLDIDEASLAYGRDDTCQLCMPLQEEGCIGLVDAACPIFWASFRDWIRQECHECVSDFNLFSGPSCRPPTGRTSHGCQPPPRPSISKPNLLQ